MSRDKRFLGFALKKSQNLGNVWMSEEKPETPFICIAHRGFWTVTVAIGKHKFEGEGATERKARIDFNTKLGVLRQSIGMIERWSRRK